MDSWTTERKSWPEFVGQDANVVARKLQAEGYEPKIVPQGSPTTRDLCYARVRLFVDSQNKIVDKPVTG